MSALMNSKNDTAELFQRFMNAYSSLSAKKNYNASLEDIKSADAVVLLGTRVASQNQEFYEALKYASEKSGAKIVYTHPIEDVLMEVIATQFMKYEPGSEEGVLALLAYHILKDVDLSNDAREFLNDLDLAYLEAESNTGEEEFEEIVQSFENSKNKLLIVGSDVIAHDRAQNIARLCALIENNSEFSFLLAPDEISSTELSWNESEAQSKLEEIAELPEFNGTVIYQLNAVDTSDESLCGSAQFARAANISDGDFISVSFDGQKIERKFKVKEDLKGTIALNPTFDISVDAKRYKFERAQIKKINQNSESNNE